jgi:heat-inducible transcriptional repressor
MSLLERDGYITQPHTSAGRVPTDRGYRYYVDHLGGAGQLSALERRQIAEFFSSATLAMDQLLAQTSQLLAGVAAHAAVVVGPEIQAVAVRAANLVLLQPRVVLAVVVLSNGTVEKEVVVFDEDVSDDEASDASACFAAELNGRRLSAVAVAERNAPAERADRIAEIVDAARVALQNRLDEHANEPLYVGGASRLAAEHDAFVTTSTARLLELLEQHAVLAALMREMLGPGLTVSIGSENATAELRECSLVLAPYLVEGERLGTVGVLGPTRMDYRKAQAAVVTVSTQLGRQLSR